MKYNISISVDERYNQLIEQIKGESEDKGTSLSREILNRLQKMEDDKQKKPLELALDSDVEQWTRFCQEAQKDEIKKVSAQAHVINILCEAYLKYESYEGHRKKKFSNLREVARYVNS